MEELIENFSLERVVKSGARFDPEKAKWFNRHYLQQKSTEELSQLFRPKLAAEGVDIEENKLVRIIDLIKERCEFVADLWEQGNYFFLAPTSYDEKTVSKKWKPETSAMLEEIVTLFEGIDQWDATIVKDP